MQLTQESHRTRWLIMIAVWCGCAILVSLHARAVRDYIRVVDTMGQRAGLESTTPMRHVIPSRYADAQMWVRLAIAGHASGDARVRFTTYDNAPQGREVHWASPLVWLLRTAGGIKDIERTLPWLNVPLLLGFVVLLSGWAARRAGVAAGVLVALAMVGHNRFYDTFAPSNVDHHGLVTAAVFGLMLGLVFMGAGWWKPNLGGTFTTLLPSDANVARRAAVGSAIFGAVGLWISAASTLPAIAVAGLAGIAVALWRGNSATRDNARFEPEVWRLWGRVGAALSMVFYLIEYAPANLGMRLEVNHPLYALAWWGGAEIVGATGGLALARARHERRPLLRRLIVGGLAVLIVPLVMFKGGERVFMLGDPFVAELRHFVIEGKSLAATVKSSGFGAVAYMLASCLLLIPAVAIGWRARGEGAVLLGFATLVAAAFMALGFWEVRWWLVGSATQIALLLVMVASVRTRWAWVLALSALVFLPSIAQRIAATRSMVRNGVIDERDVLQPLYRDIAAALRSTQPEGDIILLASPNASMGIGYYGNFKTIGTLFWENAAGLKAAGTLFSARNEEEAARIVRARGITHVAMVSSASFLPEYYSLLHPNADVEGVKATFGYRLATDHADASWLQPIAYRPPPDLEMAQANVVLFKVSFEQTEMERLYHTAVALAASGKLAAAEASLTDTLARIPVDARFPFAESVGAAFYEYDADAAAIRAFRRALEFKPDPGVATTLAWIMATTSDAAARDGRSALALVEPIAMREPNDPTVLSALAAALAELGRFTEAVTIGERALAVAQATGEAAALPLLQQRLEAYRTNRPWRQ